MLQQPAPAACCCVWTTAPARLAQMSHSGLLRVTFFVSLSAFPALRPAPACCSQRFSGYICSNSVSVKITDATSTALAAALGQAVDAAVEQGGNLLTVGGVFHAWRPGPGGAPMWPPPLPLLLPRHDPSLPSIIAA